MTNQRTNRYDNSFIIPRIPSLILYFFTMTILLLDMTNNFPGTSILRKIKYILIFFMAVDCFASGRFRIKKEDFIIFGGLLLHTVLFGMVFVNDYVAAATHIHCREMLIYLLFLYFTLSTIRIYDCRDYFIEFTCWAFVVFLIWTGVTHFSNFVNPIYFVNALSRNGRFRGTFGTFSPNYTGYICLIALIFMFLLIQEYKRRGELFGYKKVFWYLMIFWAFCMLMSTGSRSSILSMGILVCLMLAKYFTERYGKIAAVLFVIVGFILLLTVILNWDSIWGDANRESNITVNYAVFLQNGDWLRGLGYVESSGFLIDIYGYGTFALDIYYAYIFFTTGLIGTVIISAVLIFVLLSLLFRRNIPDKFYMVSVYIALLFDGMWQVNILTYRYAPTVCIFALIFALIGENGFSEEEFI